MTVDVVVAGEALLGASPARLAGLLSAKSVDTTYTARRGSHIEQHRRALAEVFRRQQTDTTLRAAAGLSLFNPRSWDTLLAAVVFNRNWTVAREFARLTAAALRGDVDLDRLDAWLRATADAAAVNINDATAVGLHETDDRGLFWQSAVTATATSYAQQMVTNAANFGARDAAAQSGARSKTWQANSGNPRSTHIALNGETVPIDSTFSNGMRWPGDPAGGAAEVSNCQCSLAFS